MSKKSSKIETLTEQFLTVSEAAELRGVSRAAIHALISRGRLDAVNVFGRKVLSRLEVEGFKKDKPGQKKQSKR